MPWKLASFGTLLAAALLTGCSTPSTSEPAKDAAVAEAAYTRCESSAAQFAVGQKASPQLLEQARTRAGAQNARILKPNDMITLEYRSDRLNLNTDTNLVITRVNCG
ncbi:I78 family peptidase inhibitor [Pseudomonas mucidolens]|uniref:I78 family peptidase inhibitor n=1 Tax=Pseudomonas mucidolens TaxID=46679 RepID=UPI0030DB2BB5